MSYGITVPAAKPGEPFRSEDRVEGDQFEAAAGEALARLLATTTYAPGVAERVDRQVRAAIAATGAVIASGAFRGPFRATINGHAEPDGSAYSEFVTVQLTSG